MNCRAYAALTLVSLGYPDQALQRSHEALTLAHDLARPFSLALALCIHAWLHGYRREWPVAQKDTDAVIALATEQGFPFFVATGTILRGGALAMQGQGDEGIDLIRQGLTAHWATGARLNRTHYLTRLAEAHGQVGQLDEGLRVVDEALALVDRTGERHWEAELHRLQGEFLRRAAGGRQGGAWTPESCLQQALAIARHQQAKWWELRAAVSLARLWREQGQRQAAYDVLAPVYAWFTEGFDTVDMQEAHELLGELAP